MGRPRRTYADDKAAARELTLDFVRDAQAVEIRELRRYLHRRALDSLLSTVIRDLKDERLIEYDAETQMVYLLDKGVPSVVQCEMKVEER